MKQNPLVLFITQFNRPRGTMEARTAMPNFRSARVNDMDFNDTPGYIYSVACTSYDTTSKIMWALNMAS